MKRKSLAVEEEQYLLSDLPEEQPLVKKGSPASAPAPGLGDRIKGIFKAGPPESRVITLSGDELKNKKGKPFVPNVIRNQKYNVFSFVPLCLYEQFKYFINFYYLVISLSQFVPALKVGYVFTYIAPLAFVVCLSMGKEAYDDYKRMVRDKACNSELYYRVCKNGHLKQIPSSEIKVGNIIIVETNRRVPADLLLLRTTEEAGASFLRTDQLDGETDWKLRRAVSITQKLDSNEDIFRLRGRIQAAAPEKDIYRFIGNFTVESEGAVESLSLENTMWASTVVASGQVTGLVLYTGRETRSQMNTSQPPSKVGILDKEINLLTVFLCILQVVLAFILVASSGFKGVWWLDFFLYNILFSNIIPISMKVNMDFAKLVYSFLIMADKDIPGCTVRNTSIPEELGRISYLLSDKTGTLTQNEMEFRRLNLGAISFSNDTLQEITEATIEEYNNPYGDSRKVRKKNSASVRQALTALALCHNVTPAIGEDGNVQYQASSPDEVALVKFTESVSMTLIDRTFTTMTIRNPLGQPEHFEILNVFPFTSARKRMGIIVRNRETGMIHFYMKGADVIMKKIVEASDWLDEECDRLAREGLRTLVFGQKIFTDEEYEDFARAFKDAETSLEDRESKVDRAIESIEDGLKLLGLTGVEDKLQFQVQETLESLRNAGIKIWMLTGDKRETATCIAISSKLVGRTQEIFQLEASNVAEAKAALAAYSLQLKSSETALIVDGGSLEIFFKHLEQEFFQATQHAPSVVCCRCAPDQKAQVVRMIKFYTKKQTAAIGDGGNDVSMIQAADIGIGIVGKEGRQASLASDFSVDQFSHISTLFLWHGRNSYHRSAVLSQFVIHRGSIITFIQASFSAVFFMSPVTIFTGMLLFGYSCWYTMAPVFCLITDEDASKENVHEFPELYTDLRKGRALSARTFLTWMLLSLYQASIIGFGCVVLGADTYLKFIDLSFTALIAVLLLDVCLVFRKWNVIMIISEIGTFAAYIFCMILFRAYYDIEYISSIGFWWRILVLIVMSFIPPLASMLLYVTFSPPAYKKLEYSV